jgi:hypothetical protein
MHRSRSLCNYAQRNDALRALTSDVGLGGPRGRENWKGREKTTSAVVGAASPELYDPVGCFVAGRVGAALSQVRGLRGMCCARWGLVQA